ncbi:MAG: hypothetical protein HFG62_02590 [Lachnospiraceae bacterium]|jgi:O-methyltransferase|nr:hypothetical protein [Lachnospiraceae bacterium]MCI8958004.1 hypothetical protein [Lachnospiraceae bacterium]
MCDNVFQWQKKIYIYPFGEIGQKLYRLLNDKLGVKQIIPVDNGRCSNSGEIIAVSDLSKVEWEKGDCILFIASDNKEIYMELRLELKQHVPDEYIIDLYDKNPLCGLCNGNDARVSSLAMVSKEIYRREIPGSVAEAGVYQGEFAKYINILFPDRKLYLFDSFDGFSESQVVEGKDNQKQTDQWITTLKDTSETLVMDKMRYRDQVIIRKGYVPETLTGIDDSFAFVSLDMDIYQPTLDALEFFWARLSPGGYIFVHDYGNYEGIDMAVTRFCSENNVGYFCLNDQMSVVIVKPLGI